VPHERTGAEIPVRDAATAQLRRVLIRSWDVARLESLATLRMGGTGLSDGLSSRSPPRAAEVGAARSPRRQSTE
jgi:hypothetical protein